MKPRHLYIGILVGVLVGVLLGIGICERVCQPGQEQPSGTAEPNWIPQGHPGQDFLPPLNEYEPPPHKFIGPEPRPTLPPLENEVHA